MVGDVRFHLDGVEEMSRLLKELGPQGAIKAAQPALKAAADIIVYAAKRNLLRKGAVRTGELLASIAARPASDLNRRSGDTQVWFAGYLRPTSRRGHFTEYGTRHSRAFPHYRPAFEENYERAFRAMFDVLGQAIEREANRQARLRPVRIRRPSVL
jgi:HK97 gp10 family phage protein